MRPVVFAVMRSINFFLRPLYYNNTMLGMLNVTSLMMMALCCFSIAIFNNMLCNMAGPLEKECRSLGQVAFPCAIFSMMATCMLFMMGGGAMSSFGR